jgi:hypothetical protein
MAAEKSVFGSADMRQPLGKNFPKIDGKSGTNG